MKVLSKTNIIKKKDFAQNENLDFDRVWWDHWGVELIT